MIKAIIFDMDGVIIDSEPYYQKVLLHILRHFGIQATSNDLLALAGGSSTHFNEIINPLIQGIISRKDFDLYHSQYYSLSSGITPINFSNLSHSKSICKAYSIKNK